MQKEQNKLNKFEIVKFLYKDIKERRIVYLLCNKGSNSDEISNLAILIVKQNFFSENFINSNILSKIEEISIFHENPPYYKFYQKGLLKNEDLINLELIHPIDQIILNKYSEAVQYQIEESYQDFQKFWNENSQKRLSQLKWIDSLPIKEKDNILFENEDFLIVYDYKFNPQKDSKESFHILTISKNKELHSIRSLNESHLELLKEMKNETFKIIKEKLNFEEKYVKAFFHYRPTFYRLHIHFINVNNNNIDNSGNRSHFLQNVINNIELVDDYYQRAKILISLFRINN